MCLCYLHLRWNSIGLFTVTEQQAPGGGGNLIIFSMKILHWKGLRIKPSIPLKMFLGALTSAEARK
jgi:hypothetical protein